MLHLARIIIIQSYLLAALHRRVAREVVQRLEPHGRVRGAEHCHGEVARVREMVHAEVEPEDAIRSKWNQQNPYFRG